MPHDSTAARAGTTEKTVVECSGGPGGERSACADSRALLGNIRLQPIAGEGEPHYRLSQVLMLVGDGPDAGGFRAGCEVISMVEAAGVEPASGSVTGEATPCSASSEFSPRRLEKRQNDVRATPDGFRRCVRGSAAATPAFGVGARGAAGALPGHRHCELITQRERDCCCSQLSFFTFLRGPVKPRHATFRVLVPVEAVSPPRALFRRAQRSE